MTCAQRWPAPITLEMVNAVATVLLAINPALPPGPWFDPDGPPVVVERSDRVRDYIVLGAAAWGHRDR